MGLSRPFRRTVRQLADGSYAQSGHGGYVRHPKYAEGGAQYVRSYLLIQKDLLELFDYVEPAERNLGCYSYRIHALMLRACVEVEANCKAILRENRYAQGDWTMKDYRNIETSHRLSSYRVVMPLWSGDGAVRTPFAAWAAVPAAPLPWYQAYNTVKHDRHEQFEQATFEHLVDACCGLVALLFAQFRNENFTGVDYLTLDGPSDGTESAIGGYFRVAPPRDWSMPERYEFDWQALKDSDADPFAAFDYSRV